MNKYYVLFGLVLVLTSFIFAQTSVFRIIKGQEEQASSTNLIFDIMRNPEKYPVLPNNLEPYVCPNGVVDLRRAVFDIKKGMSPGFVYDVKDLECGN